MASKAAGKSFPLKGRNSQAQEILVLKGQDFSPAERVDNFSMWR
jgi:hypothetical protein